MKKSDTFSKPQRQSQYAIIFIVLRFIRRIIRQIWPLFLALVLGRSRSSFDLFEISIAGLGIFGMIASILAYFKYYYHLTDSELIISQGILKKIKLNVPFERIQSVNFRQTFVHQFFKVTEVEIETAGSSGQETKIDAIDLPTAAMLRTRILEKKAAALNEDYNAEKESLVDADQIHDILQLKLKDLLRVGLVQNHLRPIGLFMGLIGTLIGYSYSFDYSGSFFMNEVWSEIEKFTTQFSDFQDNPPISEILLLLLVLIILSVLFSVISTILRHYNLRFWRAGTKFQLVQGLITKNEFAALDNKIQILNWGQNPFERIIGFYNIVFHQAVSRIESRRKRQFGIPGCQIEQIEYVKKSWLGPQCGQFNEYKAISVHYFIRLAMYQAFFFGLITAATILYNKYFIFIPVILIWGTWTWLTWISYKKKRFAYNTNEFYVGGGIVGFRHALLPLHKIQNVSITQNPYQWRRDLATLVVNTAGGRVKIPYIAHKEARGLMDRLTYHVESSIKPWM